MSREVILIYDGRCPVCRFYSRMIRVRAVAGELTVINARDTQALPEVIQQMDMNLDDGMILIVGESVYAGADALHRLALMGGRSDILNRWHYWLFRSRRRSRWLYPVFRAIRNGLLWILRIPSIEDDR